MNWLFFSEQEKLATSLLWQRILTKPKVMMTVVSGLGIASLLFHFIVSATLFLPPLMLSLMVIVGFIFMVSYFQVIYFVAIARRPLVESLAALKLLKWKRLLVDKFFMLHIVFTVLIYWFVLATNEAPDTNSTPSSVLDSNIIALGLFALIILCHLETFRYSATGYLYLLTSKYHWYFGVHRFELAPRRFHYLRALLVSSVLSLGGLALLDATPSYLSFTKCFAAWPGVIVAVCALAVENGVKPEAKKQNQASLARLDAHS